MADFLIGTSGYDYPEWKGVFYPQNLKRTDFLAYYATVFNALELNFSFYGMPTPERLASFYERTEGKIKFSVKANQSLTHQIDLNWKQNAEIFMDALKPLQEKAVLSAVLFQFPESFHYTAENRIYLAKLLQTFAGFPCIIEFRHKEWIKESVFEGIEKLNASLCFCDMPDLKNLPDMDVKNLSEALKNSDDFICPFIGPNAYIRLHGRNANAWYAGSENSVAENVNASQTVNAVSAGNASHTENASSTENAPGVTDDGNVNAVPVRNAPENTSASNGSARYTYDYSNNELAQFVPVINNAMNKGKTVHVFFNNHPNGSGAKNARHLKEMVQLSNLKIF